MFFAKKSLSHADDIISAEVWCLPPNPDHVERNSAQPQACTQLHDRDCQGPQWNSILINSEEPFTKSSGLDAAEI